MAQSQIHDVIERHGLVAGDAMRTVHGNEIGGSVVLDAHTFIHPEDAAYGGFRLIRERAIQGDEISLFLSNKALRALKAIDAD